MSLKESYNCIPVSELKEFLDEKDLLFNNPEFIVKDPIPIPRLFTARKDRETAGFLAATIAAFHPARSSFR
ncbi:MAG TPA: hypothetical protein VMT63_01395 [Bacteroidales bacterium]|nr:hypothetical protein [Bacteroidales bacterium]